MMGKVDGRGKLQEEPYSFRVTKDRRVFIHWHGRQVTILKGKTADQFIASMENADAQKAQLIMARVTGHFKHGNER
jgi:hypothetical protein